MPWPALGAALVAFGTFGLVAGFKPLLIAFFLLVGGSYFSTFRLGDSMLRWWVRIGLLLLAVSLHLNDVQQAEAMIGTTRGRNVLAMAAAAEVVFQFWRHRPRDPQWGPLAVLLFSGCMLTASTNTTYEVGISIAAPLFFGLSLLTISGLRRGKHARSLALQAAVLLVSLTLAALSTGFVSRRRNELMDLGLSLMAGRLSLPQEQGMGESPSLGPLFNQQGSPARILRAEGFDGGHLRGATFFHYSHGNWQPGISARQYAPAGSNTLAVRPPKNATTSDVIVTRLSTGYPLVYLPLSTTSVDLGDAENPEFATLEDGPVRVTERPPYVYRFRYVDGAAGETFQGVLASELKPEMRARCLLVPEDIAPKLAELARAAARGAKTDQQKIAAVVETLQEEHEYSLRYRMWSRVTDPVVDFLVNKSDAHCEFFASSAALLLRSLGVPTRYVTGFYAHENDGNDAVVVRQRDAHAWVEAYVDGVGWVTVEATPPSGLPSESKDSVEPWRRAYEWAQDRLLRLKDWLADLPPEQLGLLSAAFLFALASIGGVRWWRDRRRRFALAPPGSVLPPPSLRELASRFERALARAGATPTPTHSWSESVACLPTGDVHDRARAFLNRYDAVRFGGREADRRSLDDSLKALERAIADARKK